MKLLVAGGAGFTLLQSNKKENIMSTLFKNQLNLQINI